MYSSLKHIDTLTAIRGYAALSVFFTHLCKEFFKGTVLEHIIVNGGAGVKIFFVLSGFLLSHVYLKDFNIITLSSVKKFILNRIARIYPLHIFTLIYAAGLLYIGIKQAPLPTVNGFIQNLILTHGWGLYGLNTFSYNSASWSISVEFFWYLLFPFLAYIINKLNKILAFFLLSYVVWLSVKIKMNFSEIIYPFLSYIAFPDSIDNTFFCGKFVFYEGTFFIAGMLSYYLVKDLSENKNWDYVCFITILIYIITYVLPENYFSISNLFLELSILNISLLISALFKTTGIFKKIIGNKLLVYIGKISFSLYLTHQCFILMLKYFLESNPVENLYLYKLLSGLVNEFSIITCIGLAAILYHYLEVPARKYIRSLGTPKSSIVV